MAEPLRVVRKEPSVTPAAEEERIIVTERDYGSAPVRQAYRTLQFAFTVAPIAAGLDKFFHVLGNWDQYLAPQIPQSLGLSGHTFMQGVGFIEIIAGIGVALKPKIFAYVVSAWLVGIIVNLLMKGEYYDVALRDLGLALAAFALAKLSTVYDRRSSRIRV